MSSRYHLRFFFFISQGTCSLNPLPFQVKEVDSLCKPNVVEGELALIPLAYTVNY